MHNVEARSRKKKFSGILGMAAVKAGWNDYRAGQWHEASDLGFDPLHYESGGQLAAAIAGVKRCQPQDLPANRSGQKLIDAIGLDTLRAEWRHNLPVFVNGR